MSFSLSSHKDRYVGINSFFSGQNILRCRGIRVLRSGPFRGFCGIDFHCCCQEHLLYDAMFGSFQRIYDVSKITTFITGTTKMIDYSNSNGENLIFCNFDNRSLRVLDSGKLRGNQISWFDLFGGWKRDAIWPQPQKFLPLYISLSTTKNVMERGQLTNGNLFSQNIQIQRPQKEVTV